MFLIVTEYPHVLVILIFQSCIRVKMATVLSFKKVSDPTSLLPILEERYPHSCFMYNQILKSSRWGERLQFFTIGDKISSGTWVLTKNLRKDYVYYLSISAPSKIYEGEQEIPPEIIALLTSNDIIDWNRGMMFVPLEKPLSKMILDISAHVHGNVTEVHPCSFYFMEKKKALDLEIKVPAAIELRRLDVEKQEEKFINDNWMYSKGQSSEEEIRKCIQNFPSAGIFVKGTAAAGVIVMGFGLISSLYTKPEYRNKGYGKLAMKYLFKECAKDGCIPTLAVETKNTRSRKFNESLGLQFVCLADFIQVKKLEVD